MVSRGVNIVMVVLIDDARNQPNNKADSEGLSCVPYIYFKY